MTVTVVELFEVIQVDHQQREGSAGTLGAGGSLLDTQVEGRPVAEPGEGVGQGHFLQLLFALPQVEQPLPAFQVALQAGTQFVMISR